MAAPSPRLFLVSLTALALAFLYAGATWAADVAAVFDWSMPPRFAVPDPPAPEGAYEIYVDGALHPDAWQVDFDACASSGPIAEYRWSIDGVPAASNAACDAFSWQFPTEGSYQVSLTVTNGKGSEHTSEQTAVVQDLLIFGLGDSYGSGEGAPDSPVPLEKITAGNAKQAALDAALAARNAAAAVYAARLAAFNLTVSESNAVLAALGRYERAKTTFAAECPSLSLDCVRATTELSAASAALVRELGRVELAHLDIDSSTSIRSALTNLRNAAKGALDLAFTAYEAAEAAVVAAQGELSAARAELQAVWQNRRCHRSSRSAQVQAARLLEERDPRSSVTFVHLSCSAATVWEGIVGPFAGIEGGAPAYPPQLDALANLVLVDPQQPETGLHRSIDAIVLSIGGNDVNFGDIIVMCSAFQSCPHAPVLDATAIGARAAWCAGSGLFASECVAHLGVWDDLENTDAEQLFRTGSESNPHPNGLDDLPANYAEVASALTSHGLGATPLYLTGYPDITRDEQGAYCGWALVDDAATRQRNLIGIDTAEMSWADAEVARPLGDTMAMVAATLGWRFVDGVRPLFGTHGYCSTDSWVVRLQEAFAIQGQPWGMVHPNEQGHAAWAEQIATAVPEPACTAGALVAVAALARLARARSRARAPMAGLAGCDSGF